MEGISNKENNNLREFSAKALGEFTKWNIKQSSEKVNKIYSVLYNLFFLIKI
jgi:hypothetical protein